MLIRMLYLSRATGPQTTMMTSSILDQAQRHNAAHGITGVLCQGQGLFLQVLEGPCSAVNQLYRKIAADSRHRDLELLLVEDITQRRFGQWTMAHVVLPDQGLLRDPSVYPAAGLQPAAVDPYHTPGRELLQRLDELLASGHPIRTVVA